MYVLTDRGAALLAQQPGRVDMKLLAQFPEYIEFRNRRKEPTTTDAPGNPVVVDAGEEQTPNEAIEVAYQKLRFELVDELLQQIKGASPEFFERLVVELLLRMGYGGSRSDAGRAIGKSGDGGIDGIIKEDRLGLDIIYIQAKKWDSTIGRPEIQKFAGALQGQRARKGVFITTSDFSQQARDYVALIDSKIVLIDGEQLAQFMMDHNLGVSTVASYEVKRVDSDYFDS
jgi:restriction system protein